MRREQPGSAGIRTAFWATGYRREYPALHVPVLDGDGDVVQRGGAEAAFIAGRILHTGRSARAT